MRFNLGACVCPSSSRIGDVLKVDAHLTNFSPATPASKACVTADISIFSSTGEREVQIEGLTVTSISRSRPENDHELYLHTVMDVDPIDEIVQIPGDTTMPRDQSLAESCEKVAQFYLKPVGKLTQHPDPPYHLPFPVPSFGASMCFDTPENKDAVENLVQSSPYRSALRFIQNVGRVLPDLLPSILPLVIEEANLELLYSRHVERVIRQIAHRYPRMNALSIVGPDNDLESFVRSGLGPTFLSFTTGRVGQVQAYAPSTVEQPQQHVRGTNLDLCRDLREQLTPGFASDLVVVSTSVLPPGREKEVLSNIRLSMSAGGFLVLLRVSQSRLKQQLAQITGSILETGDLLGQSEWVDILNESGYERIARNSDQERTPGLSISVRQNYIPSLEPQANLLGRLREPLVERLLIIGSGTKEMESLGHRLKSRLSSFCGTVSSQESLEVQEPPKSLCFDSIIVLADLDRPILSNMTERSLKQLKDLLQPNMTVLWLTLDARSGSPNHAATFGFTRTVAAEIPNLNLQVLDLEQIDHADDLIIDAFVRLAGSDSDPARSLRTKEPEIHMDGGRRMIPRILPLKEANERINAQRRVVSRPINTILNCVEIVADVQADGSLTYNIRQSDENHIQKQDAGHVTLQVAYSSVEIVRLGLGQSGYVCFGRDMTSGAMMVAFSFTNASYIHVPISRCHLLTEGTASGYLLVRSLIHYLVAWKISQQASKEETIIIDGDEDFLECVQQLCSIRRRQVTFWTTKSPRACPDVPRIRLHPRSSDRQVKSAFPPLGAIIYDLSEPGELSDRIIKLLPKNCKYQPRSTLLRSHHSSSAEWMEGPDVRPNLSMLVSLALRRSRVRMLQAIDQPAALSVAQLVSNFHPGSLPPFSTINWRAVRDTVEIVKPLVEKDLFSPAKTYILVGLTRDFGQSLTRHFVEHGARHVVLASRNPQVSPNWSRELSRISGAQIRIDRLDVTKLEDVNAFKAGILKTMPPVGGVINGAMVLDDRVFSQMTLETWNRVLLPKTVGSKNLDLAFSEPDLEFFIMTSSFAAIGGHPGQSNYAAANMYMNGLAANRRRRGLAASVINIGVIYGLGFLQREKENLYAGLEREGYPPVSERDIHHMFLEAIVAGRPGLSDQPVDITTGLSRFKWGAENSLHWHHDPRFSHLTLSDDYLLESDPQVKTQISLMDELISLRDVEAMTEKLVAAFTERLEFLMQLSSENLNRHSSLTELGIDSLIAVDIRNWFWKKLGRDVAVLKLLGSNSIYQRKTTPPIGHED